MNSTDNKNGNWTFFSNNAHVLVCLTHQPQPTTREIALKVGITERAVQRILQRLVSADVVQVTKVGRRNYYDLDLKQHLRHPLESHKSIGEFIKLIDNNYEVID